MQTGQLVQVKCPLTGKDLDLDTAIEIEGVKTWFCCNDCKAKVSKAVGDEQLEIASWRQSC